MYICYISKYPGFEFDSMSRLLLITFKGTYLESNYPDKMPFSEMQKWQMEEIRLKKVGDHIQIISANGNKILFEKLIFSEDYRDIQPIIIEFINEFKRDN